MTTVVSLKKFATMNEPCMCKVNGSLPSTASLSIVSKTLEYTHACSNGCGIG